MLRLSFSIFLALIVSACATPNIDPAYDITKARGAGVVTGSITYDGVYGAYILHVTEQTTGENYRIEHGSSQTLNLVLAFRGEDTHPALAKKGAPFAVELPVGTYTVRAWQVSSGAANIHSALPIPVAFKVEAGQAIYLGNYHFHEISRLARLPTRASVTLSEQSARDQPAIKSSFSSLGSVPLTQSIAAGAVIDNLGGPSSAKINIPIIIPVGR